MKRFYSITVCVLLAMLLCSCAQEDNLDDMDILYKLPTEESPREEISEEDYNELFTAETRPYIQINLSEKTFVREDYSTLTQEEYANMVKEYYRELNQSFLDQYDFGDLETSFTSYGAEIYIKVPDLSYKEVLKTIQIFYDNEDIVSVTVCQDTLPVAH